MALGRKLLQSVPNGVQIALNIQSPADLSDAVQQALQQAVQSGQFQANLASNGMPAFHHLLPHPRQPTTFVQSQYGYRFPSPEYHIAMDTLARAHFPEVV